MALRGAGWFECDFARTGPLTREGGCCSGLVGFGALMGLHVLSRVGIFAVWSLFGVCRVFAVVGQHSCT